MTTDKAPMGVTKIASVKALPDQLPLLHLRHLIRLMVHHLLGQEVQDLPNDHHGHSYLVSAVLATPKASWLKYTRGAPTSPP